MNEESIKKFLTTCVYQEMNSFHPSQDEDYNHEFSKKFMKRWKRLNIFWQPSASGVYRP